MKPKLLALSIATSLTLGFAALPAQAIGSLADITIVDRDSGSTLPVYYSRGEYWVAGKPGARYAVAVRNKLGARVLVVPSVDGVNVLSGETAAFDQRGYVFSSYERYQITGWRKSNTEVAAFEFASAGDSYAGRTGRPGSIGVIGVALFREQAPEPVAQPYPAPPPYYSGRMEPGSEQSANRYRAAPAAPSAAAPAEGSMGALKDRAESEASSGAAFAKKAESAAPIVVPSPTARLGTAHGARETSVVGSTTFVRQQSQPNEVIRIRYDSRENLIASGIIREPVARGPVPDPFPDSANASYVPDPPQRRY